MTPGELDDWAQVVTDLHAAAGAQATAEDRRTASRAAQTQWSAWGRLDQPVSTTIRLVRQAIEVGYLVALRDQREAGPERS